MSSGGSNFFNTSNALGQFNVQEGDLLNSNFADIILGRFNSEKTDRNVITGYSEAIDQNIFQLSPEGPYNGVDITFPLGATTMQIASSSVNDTSAGTGMRTARIIGLDFNFNPLSEVIIMTGQTPVSTTGEYLRINDLVGLTAGSTRSNEGIVAVTDIADSFTSGAPDTRSYKTIFTNDFISKSFTYTIPNGFIFAPMKIVFQTNATATRTLEARLIKSQRAENSDGSGSLITNRIFIAQGGVEINLAGLRGFDPKTDISMSVFRNTGNGTITCHADLYGILRRQY